MLSLTSVHRYSAQCNWVKLNGVTTEGILFSVRQNFWRHTVKFSINSPLLWWLCNSLGMLCILALSWVWYLQFFIFFLHNFEIFTWWTTMQLRGEMRCCKNNFKKESFFVRPKFYNSILILWGINNQTILLSLFD